MGAHSKPGGLLKQIMGNPALRPGEDPMDKYLRNPLSAEAGMARSVKTANAMGIDLRFGPGGRPYIANAEGAGSGGGRSSGGGGGGGGGRMGPRGESKVGVRVGPRTSAEYVAKHGGLSPQRPSTLAAAYRRGDITSGWKPAKEAPPSGDTGGVPVEQAFDPVGGTGAGAGKAVGEVVGSMLAGGWPTKRLATGGYVQPGEEVVVGDQPPWVQEEKRLSSNSQDAARHFANLKFGRMDPRTNAFANPGTGRPTFATGGTVLPGQEAVVGDLPPWPSSAAGPRPEILVTPDGRATPVGLRGEEIIAPPQGGVVIPNPLTVAERWGRTFSPTPGQMFQSPGGAERGMLGPHGSGFSYKPVPAEQGELGETMVVEGSPRLMIDPRTGYQMDMDAQGMPLRPDVVTGPWAQQGMTMTPEQRQQLTQSTRGAAMKLAYGRGAVESGRYPGLLFDDIGPESRYQAVLDAGGTVQQAIDSVANDAALSNNRTGLTFEELQRRVALRGVEANNRLFDIRDRAERDRVQQDLANRAARAPIGTPTAPQASGLSPSAQRKQERAMEQFLTTPQGAMWAAEQEQQAASAQAAGQWQMMTDPSTGKPFAMVNGRGQTVSLPRMEEDERIVTIEEEGVNEFGMPIIRKTPVIANMKNGTTRRFAMDDGAVVQAPASVKPKPADGNADQPASAPAAAGANNFVNRFKKRN